MHTELTAVPHAGLGYHFLRVQVRTIGSWGLQEEVGPKAQDRKRRTGRDDVVRSCLPSSLALYWKLESKLVQKVNQQVRAAEQAAYPEDTIESLVGHSSMGLLCPPAL